MSQSNHTQFIVMEDNGIPGGFGNNGCCPRTSQYWGGLEYLLWWVEDAPTPPLASTTNDLTQPRRGAVDLPSTTILYGHEGASFDPFSGGRFTIGGWIDDCQTFGVEVSGFVLEQNNDHFRAGELRIGASPLYIPAFRSELGVEGSLIISDVTFPAAGILDINSTSQLWGTEINAVRNLSRSPDRYFDVLAGFRYLDLDESLFLTTFIIGNGTPFTVSAFDHFATENRFYGGQIGFKTGVKRGRFSFDFIGKLALGATHQQVRVNGQITQTGFPAANGFLGTFPGGVLSQPTNLGERSRNQFAVIPEVTLKVNYHVTDRLNVFTGYNFLWISSVARPGDQIDHNVNKTQQGGGTLVGPATPVPIFRSTGMWAQGLLCGLELRY